MTMGALFPIYVEGTRSLLLRATTAKLSPGNRAAFSLAACCIYFPIIYAWRRSWRLGASVQLAVLAGIALWLYYFDALVLITWYGYAGRLFLGCAGIAALMSALLWITSNRGTRAGT